MLRCSHRTEWIIRSTSAIPFQAGFFVIGQSGQAISSRNEPPSERFCRHLHPSPNDMRHHPIWLHCLSSASLRQPAREHLTSSPSSGRFPSCQSFRALAVALRQQSATALSRLHEPHLQRLVRPHTMRVCPPPFQVGQQLWSLLGLAQVRLASAATPCLTVRFTRSMKAVFSRPEKPSLCKAALRSASVPSRVTCETRTSLSR